MYISRWTLLIVSLITVATGSAQARSDWPAKPVRIVVPFAAGGTTDINQLMYPKMPYDTTKDFTPVSFAVRVPNGPVLHPLSGAQIN